MDESVFVCARSYFVNGHSALAMSNAIGFRRPCYAPGLRELIGSSRDGRQDKSHPLAQQAWLWRQAARLEWGGSLVCRCRGLTIAIDVGSTVCSAWCVIFLTAGWAGRLIGPSRPPRCCGGCCDVEMAPYPAWIVPPCTPNGPTRPSAGCLWRVLLCGPVASAVSQ